MNDPLDRLGEAFQRVPVPDQWSEIEARAAAADAVQVAGVGVSRRSAGVRWALAAACVAGVVAGIVAIMTRSTDTPAIAPNETLPEPAPATTATPATTTPDSVLTAVTPAVSTPPPVPVGPVMPCASRTDLDAVQAVLRSGLAERPHERAVNIGDLVGRSETVLRASLVAAERAVTGSTTLHLVEIERLAGVDAGLTSIQVETDGPLSPDPLVSPVTFDAVELLIFASRDAAGTWRPDPQGLYAECTFGSWLVRALLDAADFLDRSSLSAMFDQVVASSPGYVAPWGRECVDQLGTGSAPIADPLAEQPFGPLESEPAMTLLYPPSRSGYTFQVPRSRVTRVPGGMLVRLESPGSGSYLQQLIAVVDDDGTIRWRRCVEGMYAGDSVAGDGVAYLEMWPAQANAVQEWWSFDLGSGESTLSDEPPNAEQQPVGLEVVFRPDPDRPLASPTLVRHATDGTELWRREDLFEPGGEGFWASEPQPIGGRELVLVRACVGSPRAPTMEPCDVLLGVDAADGQTVWQGDVASSVSLVADGFAIVEPSGTYPSSFQLIDLSTGAVLPAGVSDRPEAFKTECCGGMEYSFVERAGGITWTVDYDHMNVWLPTGNPGPRVAVDLLGRASERGVDARWGPSAVGHAGCSGDSCKYLDAVGWGFAPGTTAEAQCWSDHGGTWAPFAGPYPLPVQPDGSVVLSNACSSGLRGAHAKVVIDGVESGALTSE